MGLEEIDGGLERRLLARLDLNRGARQSDIAKVAAGKKRTAGIDMSPRTANPWAHPDV